MSKKYIAYGSNLSVEQMAHRCPDAKVIGKTIIPDWRLVFRTHATIEPQEGANVQALIWEISEADEKNLDIYEGYPYYYTKKDMLVEMRNLDWEKPEMVSAMVYLMNEGRPVQAPTASYYATLKEGYKRFGFFQRALERALKETL